MNIGENIRALRTSRNLSQTEFAKTLGLSKETISRWERGSTSIRSKHLDLISSLYNVSKDELVSHRLGLAHRSDLLENSSDSNYDTSNEALQNDAEKQKLLLKCCSIPSYKISRSGNGTTLTRGKNVLAPPDIAVKHPKSFFLILDSQSMNRLYPVNSNLLVDQKIKPWNGCTIVGFLDNEKVIFGRYASGNNTIIISSWSYTSTFPDIIVDARRLRILGVVVWFQSTRDIDLANA